MAIANISGAIDINVAKKVADFSLKIDKFMAKFDKSETYLSEIWLYPVVIFTLIYCGMSLDWVSFSLIGYWIVCGLRFKCFWFEPLTNFLFPYSREQSSSPVPQQRYDTSVIISYNDAEEVDLETAKTNKSINSLHFAALSNDMSVLREILKDRPDLVNSLDRSKSTCLHYACYEGHLYAVDFLLDNGAIHHLKNPDGWTPLMNACVVNRTEVLRHLIYKRAGVNAVNNQGWSALMIASDAGHIKIVQILLDAGANINFGSHCTSLMIACNKGHQDVATYLVQRGADIFIKSSVTGDTAFTYASRAGLYKMMVELVHYDFDIYQKNNNGLNALQQYKNLLGSSISSSDVQDLETIKILFRRRNNLNRRKNFLIFLSGSKLIVNNYKDCITDINTSRQVTQVDLKNFYTFKQPKMTFQDFETNQKLFEDSKINFDFVIGKYCDNKRANANRFNQYWNSNSSHYLVLSDINILIQIMSYM